MSAPYIKLTKQELPKDLHNFSLDTVLSEADMMAYANGVDLGQKHEEEIDKEYWKMFVPEFESDKLKFIPPNHNRKQIGLTSMYLNDRDELWDHISQIYQVMYSHYLLMKNSNGIEAKRFPKNCCGYSSRRILAALFEHGYDNAIYTYNYKYDHAYVALPFVLDEKRLFCKTKGIILADPTSDQLWKEDKEKRRNNVTIKLGSKWEYRTDWKGGGNLYPSSHINLFTIQKKGEGYYEDLRKTFSRGVLRKAFRNNIWLDLDSD
jgi:hypothetical protein